MRALRTIETPWAPYSVTFSRDGTRLAVGGGSWDGEGGGMLADLASGEAEVLEMATSRGARLSVSGVCFSPDDRHLAASTWSSGHHYGPTLLFAVGGLKLTRLNTFDPGPWEGWGECP